ncbi:HNH endonuclease signature motif containing protein, partial [Arthrobacter sp. STN4]|uniref:HNH endonuclease n=1 Tax=Arthrobacter sp. STN4 TaxID=2923276 RepID=UPI00211A2D32
HTGTTDGMIPGQTLLDIPATPDPPRPDTPPATTQAQPWPRLVNGIWVPEPGSDQELPGLDPIDPDCTNPVVADRRTRAQKLLDGLIDCIKLAARTGKLPMNGGLKPQLFISTNETELQRHTKDGRPGGIAFLPYSGPQPLALLEEELCDADITTMILGNGENILNVGRTQRFFTDTQRKILIARDKGCCFPHCRRTAMTTDAHHIIPWSQGGGTDISNGALLCTVHHHTVHQGLWSIELINGTPWFTPCYKLDPTQTKLRNHYHHGLPGT